MIYKNEKDFQKKGGITISDEGIAITDREIFRRECVDDLLDTIILGDSEEARELAFQTVRAAAREFCVVPYSIQSLYEAKAKENLIHFTVPAINLRTLTSVLAGSVFRSAKKIDAGAFIFEIARSEIGYTEQRPMEYTSHLILAAVREGYEGPLFIQGDHFQVNPKKFKEDREKEIGTIKNLIIDAIDAGFYNIDIDSSTLVDLSKESITEQQRLNFEVCAELNRFIRDNQHEGIAVSVGGEIGEVGKQNSTAEELRAFMDGFNDLNKGYTGISKVSIQTGTSHGGVVLPDGTIAKVKIDFDTLKNLSRIAREEYGMSGAVQHGASTLPKDAFDHFPANECAEVHLATQFQNIVYDYLPVELRDKIYAWLDDNMQNERKPDMTDDQFYYKTRKKALGPFKKEIHSLSRELKDKIAAAMEEEYDFLFDKLNIKDTRFIVNQYIQV
ncbi:MAG: class II fructose-bisphosphate aldolase [Acidobacteria bacterium]|nr:class II fructose-bisphosphate aldolase [Acidobacteriota bacterium]